MRRLLLDLDSNGGTDPLGMFLLFFKRTADVRPIISLAVSFWLVLRFCSFPVRWRATNVTQIPKGQPKNISSFLFWSTFLLSGPFQTVVDLNSMGEFNYYFKTSIVFII